MKNNYSPHIIRLIKHELNITRTITETNEDKKQNFYFFMDCEQKSYAKKRA